MPSDLTHRPVRSHVEAVLLDAGAAATHKLHGRFKEREIGALTGVIVELGPGTGANMRYYGAGVQVIGIEPNPAMHHRLADAATKHSVALEIRTLRGESLEVPDASADAVVGTLVLCGVDDPEAVLAEVLRVLRPGGSFVFVEHVGAADGSNLRRVQAILRRAHRWMFNGCDVTRDTATTIEGAGFSKVVIEEVLAGPEAMHVRTQVRGVATA